MKKVDIDKVVSLLKKETAKKGMTIPIVTEISWTKSPFKVLISTMLSLRTKDAVTASASNRLFSVAGTAEKLAALPVKKIEELIYPVGFYKTKAPKIKEASRRIIDEYKGKVPDEIDELLKFDGVGRKTANLVVTLGYGKLGVCVDTHVHRISNRLGYVKTKSPDETEMALRKRLPKKHWIIYNDLLVTWGQNVCVPISPWCSRCVINKWCNRVGVERSR
ncbi:TPA: endonuclease III [Candidatus Woesearchaeota archaeon]|nr:endonuclease III [Candidatus Woesearchaeota archaeon]